MDKNELSREQLSGVAGGKLVFRYVCNECLNEIPADSEERVEGLSTNLNDPSFVESRFLKFCPFCNKFVEYYREVVK